MSELHNSSILSTMLKSLSSVPWIILVVLPLSLLFQFLMTFSFPVFPKLGFSLMIPFPLSNLEELSSFHSTVHIFINFIIGFILLFKVHVHIYNRFLKSFFLCFSHTVFLRATVRVARIYWQHTVLTVIDCVFTCVSKHLCF